MESDHHDGAPDRVDSWFYVVHLTHLVKGLPSH
jgi:hypothetical protein